MFALVSTRTGQVVCTSLVDDVQRGFAERWPDFVTVRVTDSDDTASIASAVLNLDALPPDYVCTAKQVSAALVAPEVDETHVADGMIVARRVRSECQREAAKLAVLEGEQAAEVAAFRAWQQAKGLRQSVENMAERAGKHGGAMRKGHAAMQKALAKNELAAIEWQNALDTFDELARVTGKQAAAVALSDIAAVEAASFAEYENKREAIGKETLTAKAEKAQRKAAR